MRAATWILTAALLAAAAGASEAQTTPTATELTLPEPYFGKGPTKSAADAFALERWQEARDGFAAYLAGKDAPGDAAGKARVRYLIAVCDANLGRWKEAAESFDAVVPDLPLLADYARYEGARAWYFAHDVARAKERVEKVAKDSVLAPEATLLLGDLLRAEGDWKGVARLYGDYLASRPNPIRKSEARFRLAEAYEKLKKPQADIIPLYRQLTIEAPLDKWGRDAKTRFDELVKKLKKSKRKKWTELTAAERIARGKIYFDGMRNEESEADFRAALDAKGLDKKLACEARYHLGQSVFKQRERARSAPFFDAAVEACAKTDDKDLQTRSAYQGARAWSAAGDHRKALALFEKAETWNPDHSFADDARLRQAEQWGYLEDDGVEGAGARLEETLASIPKRFPDGDMKAEALWRLAWRAWKAGKYDETVRWLDEAIKEVPHDDNYFAEGQTHYWKGRAFEKLGKPDEAHAAWERCAREYPLSYYTLLALNRLRDAAPKKFEKLMTELRRPPAGFKKGTSALVFKARPEYGQPGFQRGVELLRLGLGPEARRELAAIGLTPPGGKKKAKDADEADKFLAIAALYDRARQYSDSHWILRWQVLDYKLSWPTEANREVWDIAYPRAWWHILDPAAKEQGYPTELLISFVREESAFNPLMESFANAIGLTQMIRPTAERFGKGLGFEMTRENLRDPVKNVAVGSRWLGFLWQKFDKRLGLLVPAYNSGEGALWKWLCVRGDWPVDEFAEEIPYDETRNYAKRVLNSYFIYTYLSNGSVPEMPNDIPESAINEKKCSGGKATRTRDQGDKPDKKQ